jgi:CheY-like chemotaxis protein
MVRPRYEDVRMLLGQGNAQHCARLQQSLQSRGMRNTAACSRTESLIAYLGQSAFDVLIYDQDLPGGDFLKTMQRIRRHELGKNPFMAVIATVEDSAPEKVKKAIDAGVDDVIRQPLSIDKLVERMALLIQARKPFVVSYDYVGPTRRTRSRPDQAEPKTIEIPNTLKSRVMDGKSDADLQALVDAATNRLDDHALDAIGFEIHRLAKRIGEHYDGEGSENDLHGDLNRLIVVAAELRESSEGTASASVADLATMLVALAQRVRHAPPMVRITEVDLLIKLSEAIHRALSVERDSVDVMNEIAATIAAFTRPN